jgi:hypothetical protein
MKSTVSFAVDIVGNLGRGTGHGVLERRRGWAAAQPHDPFTFT